MKSEIEIGLAIEVPDFEKTIFDGIDGLDDTAVERVFNQCGQGDGILYNKKWINWKSAAQKDVLDFLEKITKKLLEIHGRTPPNSRILYRGPNKNVLGSTGKRKMYVGISNDWKHKKIPHWQDILVVGQLKENCKETYAREVFRLQDRRFVLGFTLCGPLMRLWHFDRSGVSASTSFHIHQDGKRFVRAMLGLFLLNDLQLGYDPSIKTNSKNERWVEFV